MCKLWLQKCLCFWSVLVMICHFSLQAQELDDNFDLSKLKGARLGYYVGSFDPIHLGHQRVIKEALKSGYVDYVLIYPAPGGDHFKNRTDLTLRQTMIAGIYSAFSKVLYTFWSPKELQDRFACVANEVDVVGIIGSDVVTESLMGPDKKVNERYDSVFMRGLPLKEKHYEDTIGSLMALKANSFLVALRGEVDLSYLDGKVGDRPIRGFIQSGNISSTEVRNAIKNQTRFEHLLSFPAQAVIKHKGLYGFPPRINEHLRRELLEMAELDQEARRNLDPKCWYDEDSWKDIAEIDTKNGLRVKEILSEYGWPGVSLVGIDGANAMWILVQHQDDDVSFQKKALELLKRSVEEYEGSPISLAYLTDRVNQNEGRPQIYGTQWRSEEGKWSLYPVEDIEHLDERRAEVGLCTFEEYKQFVRTSFDLTDDDFF